MNKWYFIIDVEKCENCQNCFLACKDEHVGNDWPGYAASQVHQGPGWIGILQKERGRYPLIDVAYLPLPCQHCEDPPCMKLAKGEAVYKRPDGIVLIDPLKARGQGQLVKACPYGVINYNEELDLPQKCTLCAHLLDEGWTKSRCVQSCPTGALGLRQMDENEARLLIEKERLEVYQEGYHTKPRAYYKNLHRFTRCFLGGSVAAIIDGKEECIAGARVTLLNPAGKEIAEERTDAFGDFKIDKLEKNSGPYKVRIAHPGFITKDLEVELTESLNMGTIYLVT